MTVEQTGSVYPDGVADVGTAKQSYTVNIAGDADLCIVIATCYASGGAGGRLNILNWDDGVDIDPVFSDYQIGENSGGNDQSVDGYYCKGADLPGTGDQTLYYGWDAADDSYVAAFCLKGVDQTDPLIGTDASPNNEDPYTSADVGDVGADDLGIIYGGEYGAAVTVNANGQTIVHQGNEDTTYLGIGKKLEEDQMQCSGDETGYLRAIAFAIAAAAAGPADVIKQPVIGRGIGHGMRF